MNTNTRRVLLTIELLEMLLKPIVGDGGHQRLARKLQARLRSTDNRHYLVVDDVIMAKVRKYAWAYGEGGFQNRWRALIAEHDRLFPARQALAA